VHISGPCTFDGIQISSQPLLAKTKRPCNHMWCGSIEEHIVSLANRSSARRYGYNWQQSEAEKNLLRTHTTAVSSRMLYCLAKEGFKPAKYFSVDRVFRNEDLDRTHLAEFHQIEGLICDRGLTLGDLIGTLHTFFERLGLKKLRFKPAYNPYTEPSMEIFRYEKSAQAVTSNTYCARLSLNHGADVCLSCAAIPRKIESGWRSEIRACSALKCSGPWACQRMSL
jgi:hypothetical protein